jgi:hypothetical protein
MNNYHSVQELEEALREDGAEIILPVYMFDHSGIAIATTPFGCSWDSGQIGVCYVTRENLIKEYGEECIAPEGHDHCGLLLDEYKDKATSVMESEIKELDKYVRGETYRFELHKEKKCGECGQIEYEEIDSCSGFIGDDPESNGIKDNLCLDLDDKEKANTIITELINSLD